MYFKQVLTIFVKDVALPQKHKPLSLVILGSQQSLPIIGFQIKKKGGHGLCLFPFYPQGLAQCLDALLNKCLQKELGKNKEK